MESKRSLWLWLLVGLLVLLFVGGGVWLGLKGGFDSIVGVGKSGLEIEEKVAEGHERIIIVSGWDSDTLQLDFESNDGDGGFKVEFVNTSVYISVPEYYDDEQNGELVEEPLLSKSSPYFERAFCMGDMLILEMSEDYFLSSKDLTRINSSDVEKIRNLGPSQCREEN